MKGGRGVKDIRGLEQGLRDGYGQNALFTYVKLLKNKYKLFYIIETILYNILLYFLKLFYF